VCVCVCMCVFVVVCVCVFVCVRASGEARAPHIQHMLLHSLCKRPNYSTHAEGIVQSHVVISSNMFCVLLACDEAPCKLYVVWKALRISVQLSSWLILLLRLISFSPMPLSVQYLCIVCAGGWGRSPE